MAAWTTAPEGVAGEWIVYRHTHRDFPPLWYGAGATTLRQESGRWHREGEGVAQYLALSADGAWAERVRYESIRDHVRRREDRRCLWEMQVVEHDVANLSTFDAYAACGLDPALAVGPHVASRELADALRAEGYRGVLSPAAALDVDGAKNLTLFGERMEWRIQGHAMPAAGENANPELWLATALLTDSGSPTEFAMVNCCYRNDHHRGLSTWDAARA